MATETIILASNKYIGWNIHPYSQRKPKIHSWRLSLIDRIDKMSLKSCSF